MWVCIYYYRLKESWFVVFLLKRENKIDNTTKVNNEVELISLPYILLQNEVTRLLESETPSFTHFILWVWKGSRYSGLLCMALSSTIYFLMGVLTNIFSGNVLLFCMVCCRFCLTLCICRIRETTNEKSI